MSAKPALHASALAEPWSLPLRPASEVTSWGRTLVIAPHPDDESLACGGAIALLRREGLPVHVLFVSDGTGSHPRSQRFPAPALAALREHEAYAAIDILGLGGEDATFLRLPDTAVPFSDAPGFTAAVARCRALLDAFDPAAILVPWRRDPHCDHRAAWQMLQAALGTYDRPVRQLEYPLWVWELAENDDASQTHEVAAWRLEIGAVLLRKLAAIAAHVSQTTTLIDDDPTGFGLLPEVLAHFEQPWEFFWSFCHDRAAFLAAAQLFRRNVCDESRSLELRDQPV